MFRFLKIINSHKASLKVFLWRVLELNNLSILFISWSTLKKRYDHFFFFFFQGGSKWLVSFLNSLNISLSESGVGEEVTSFLNLRISVMTWSVVVWMASLASTQVLKCFCGDDWSESKSNQTEASKSQMDTESIGFFCKESSVCVVTLFFSWRYQSDSFHLVSREFEWKYSSTCLCVVSWVPSQLSSRKKMPIQIEKWKNGKVGKWNNENKQNDCLFFVVFFLIVFFFPQFFKKWFQFTWELLYTSTYWKWSTFSGHIFNTKDTK